MALDAIFIGGIGVVIGRTGSDALHVLIEVVRQRDITTGSSPQIDPISRKQA